jgi:hypothetical protein
MNKLFILVALIALLVFNILKTDHDQPSRRSVHYDAYTACQSAIRGKLGDSTADFPTVDWRGTDVQSGVIDINGYVDTRAGRRFFVCRVSHGVVTQVSGLEG